MNTLILVDYQNVFKICQKKEIQLDEIFKEIIKKGEAKGGIREIRLFVPNYQHAISPWRLINQLQLAYGVSVETCPVLREGTEGEEGDEEKYKDLVDGMVFSWLTKYVQPAISPRLIVFVTGDGHFILSAQEAIKRKKEVEFWILDPEKTSQALLKYLPYEKLELKITEETNPFALVLKKRLEPRVKLNEEEIERIKVLKKIQKFLSSLPSHGIEPQITKDFLSQATAKVINIDREEIQKAIEGLINLRVIQIHSTYSIDSNSPYFQWLEYFET